MRRLRALDLFCKAGGGYKRPTARGLPWFDRRMRVYQDAYTLGRLKKNGTQWEQLKPTERPGWARGHHQIEMELEQ